MTPLRVALVHSFYDSSRPSGENDVVVAETNALARAGFAVELFSARTDELQHQSTYRLRSALRVASGRGANPLSQLNEFDPDIVHVHNLFPNFSRRWVEDLRVPLVQTLHNYRPICASGTLFRSGDTCTLCPDGDRWAGIRNRCYRDSVAATAPIAWSNRRGPSADPVLRRAARLILLSQRQARQYERAGLSMDKTVISSNFLPTALEADEAAVGSPIPDEPGYVFAGRLTPEKGILQLLECWPHELPLTVIGDGPLRSEVERRTGRGRIRLRGQVSRQATVATIRSAVALVWPSIGHETFGLTYIEALSGGTPVLSFTGTPVAETVLEDGTGVVSDWSAPSITRAASYVVQRRPELSAHCLRVFKDRYTENAYVTRTSNLYSEVLREYGA